MASRRDAEQLLLHPDPSLLELAQQRQRDQIEAWIASRQLQHPSPAMADPQRPPPRRWLLIGTQRLPQCFLYRVEQKQEQLKALGWTSRVLREEELSATDRDTTLGWADAVILCRLEVSPDLLDWIQAARDRGIPACMTSTICCLTPATVRRRWSTTPVGSAPPCTAALPWIRP